jgi:hypothetical protein
MSEYENEKPDWAAKEQEKLKECVALAKVHPLYLDDKPFKGKTLWIVTNANGDTLTRSTSIWKIYDWLEDRMPWAKGDGVYSRDTDAIKKHYENLFVPNHVKDTTDYSLTDSEKDEIKAGYAARLIPAAEELEALVKPPYSVICDTRFPDCLFVLCNADGDVIKEDQSPWVVQDYYEKICLT